MLKVVIILPSTSFLINQFNTHVRKWFTFFFRAVERNDALAQFVNQQPCAATSEPQTFMIFEANSRKKTSDNKKLPNTHVAICSWTCRTHKL